MIYLLLLWAFTFATSLDHFETFLAVQPNDFACRLYNRLVVRNNTARPQAARDTILDLGAPDDRYDFARDYAASKIDKLSIHTRKSKQSKSLKAKMTSKKPFTATPSKLNFENKPLCSFNTATIVLKPSKSALNGLELLAVTSNCPEIRAHLLPKVKSSDKRHVAVAVVPQRLTAQQCRLTMHSNQGAFVYRVDVSSVRSLYGVAPLLGGHVSLPRPHNGIIDYTKAVVDWGKRGASSTNLTSTTGVSLANCKRTPNIAYYEQTISVHNPHAEPMLVREVRTSGDDMHVTMPPTITTSVVNTPELASLPSVVSAKDNEELTRQALAGMWRIEPRATRSVAMLRVAVGERRRFEGYVTVLTDKERLVVPVVVHGEKDGVHASPPSIDFGVLIAPHARRRAAVRMLSAGARPVRVVSAHIEPAALRDVLSVELLAKHRVLTHSLRSQVVARVIHHTDAPALSGAVRGSVVILTNDTNPRYSRLAIPITSHVLHGGIALARRNKALLKTAAHEHVRTLPRAMRAALDAAVPRTLTLTNAFTSPLAVLNVTSSSPTIRISDFKPQIIPAGADWTAGIVRLVPSLGGAPLPRLEFLTNASLLKIPMILYNGKLSTSISSAHHGNVSDDVLRSGAALTMTQVLSGPVPTKIDFGRIATSEYRSVLVNMTNTGAFDVSIEDISTDMSSVVVVGRPRVLLDSPRCQHYAQLRATPAPRLCAPAALNCTNTAALEPLTPHDLERPAGIDDAPHTATLTSLGLLAGGCTALVELQLRPRTAGNVRGALIIKTEFETFNVSLQYRAMSGRLELLTTDGGTTLDSDEAAAAHYTLEHHERAALDIAVRSTFERRVSVNAVRCDDSRVSVARLARSLPTDEHKFVARVRRASHKPSRAEAEQLTACDRLLAPGTLLVDTRGAAGDDAAATLDDERPNEAILDDDDDSNNLHDDDEEQDTSDDDAVLGDDEDDGVSLYAYRHDQTPGLPRNAIARWSTMYSLAAPSTQVQFARFAERYRILAGAMRVNASLSVHNNNNNNSSEPAHIIIETDVAQPLRVPVTVPSLPHRVLRRQALRLGRVQVDRLAAVFIAVRNPNTDTAITAQLLVPRDSESAGGQVRVPYEVARRRVLLTPGSTARLGPVLIMPSRRGALRATLHVASNVTPSALESVSLHANAGSGALALSGVSSGGEVLFEYQRAALRRVCANSSFLSGHGTPHARRRSLTLRNDGDLPLRVTKVTIGGRECQSHGFALEQCVWPLPSGQLAFELPPGAKRSLSFRFVPDFVESELSTPLVFHTLGAGQAEFSLRAVLPPELLLSCSAALPLSASEQRARWLIVALAAVVVAWLTHLLIADALAARAESARRVAEIEATRLTARSERIVQKQAAASVAALTDDEVAAYLEQARRDGTYDLIDHEALHDESDDDDDDDEEDDDDDDDSDETSDILLHDDSYDEAERAVDDSEARLKAAARSGITGTSGLSAEAAAHADAVIASLPALNAAVAKPTRDGGPSGSGRSSPASSANSRSTSPQPKAGAKDTPKLVYDAFAPDEQNIFSKNKKKLTRKQMREIKRLQQLEEQQQNKTIQQHQRQQQQQQRQQPLVSKLHSTSSSSSNAHAQKHLRERDVSDKTSSSGSSRAHTPPAVASNTKAVLRGPSTMISSAAAAATATSAAATTAKPVDPRVAQSIAENGGGLLPAPILPVPTLPLAARVKNGGGAASGTGGAGASSAAAVAAAAAAAASRERDVTSPVSPRDSTLPALLAVLQQGTPTDAGSAPRGDKRLREAQQAVERARRAAMMIEAKRIEAQRAGGKTTTPSPTPSSTTTTTTTATTTATTPSSSSPSTAPTASLPVTFGPSTFTTRAAAGAAARPISAAAANAPAFEPPVSLRVAPSATAYAPKPRRPPMPRAPTKLASAPLPASHHALEPALGTSPDDVDVDSAWQPDQSTLESIAALVGGNDERSTPPSSSVPAAAARSASSSTGGAAPSTGSSVDALFALPSFFQTHDNTSLSGDELGSQEELDTVWRPGQARVRARERSSSESASSPTNHTKASATTSSPLLPRDAPWDKWGVAPDSEHVPSSASTDAADSPSPSTASTLSPSPAPGGGTLADLLSFDSGMLGADSSLDTLDSSSRAYNMFGAGSGLFGGGFGTFGSLAPTTQDEDTHKSPSEEK